MIRRCAFETRRFRTSEQDMKKPRRIARAGLACQSNSLRRWARPGGAGALGGDVKSWIATQNSENRIGCHAV